MASKRYRAGAIGRTGKGDYGHGLHTCYADVDGVDLVAIADEDPGGRRRAAADTGAARSYSDFGEMLQKEELDLVSVCPRWVDCHEEMLLACVEAGVHVYCEKPMASSLESADRIVEAASDAGVRIAVAHQAVYLPQVNAIRDLLKEGRIGPLRAFYASGKQDRRGGGEDMLVLGTHLFNLMRFFGGDPLWVFASVTADGEGIATGDVREAGEPIGPIAGDCVDATFGFAGGVTGHFVSRARPDDSSGRHYGLEIVGETGRLSICGNAWPFSLLDNGAYVPWDSSQTRQPLDIPSSKLFAGNRLAILDLVEAIEQERAPISSAADARAALEMILGAYQSQIEGRRISFPMANRTHPLERLARRDTDWGVSG